MRLSKFNEIIKCGDEYLLYNLYSGAILVLDEHYKEKYEQIKAAAVRNGESVNGYIKKAIDERIERNSL